MTPVFGNDPWWIIVLKVVMVFVILLLWTIFNVWFERRVLGKMQNRKGPIMNGPFGLGQALGDGVKLLFKEDFRPARTDAIIFNMGPLLISVAAFTTWTVIPFGGEVSIFGHTTNLQITDLPVAVLFILAVASIGFYGVVLAGWSSSGSYSLLGSMRAAAQLISYEIAMGLSMVAVFMMAGSMSTSAIVAAQAEPIVFFGMQTPIRGWYALLLIPSFVIYVISMFGETNRQPFDMAECESELVSGHLTDYSGFRYALFFLSEYINMATVSAVATTLFLGGHRAPWPLADTFFDGGWWGPLWFIAKVQLLMFFFSWVRASVLRVRYDQFMRLGWVWLIEINLAWIILITIVRGGMNQGWITDRTFLLVAGAVVMAILALVFLADRKAEKKLVLEEAKNTRADGTFDAFAGGYPVPPMPGEVEVELVSAMSEPIVPATRMAPDEESEA